MFCSCLIAQFILPLLLSLFCLYYARADDQAQRTCIWQPHVAIGAHGQNLHAIRMDYMSGGQPGNPVTQSVGTSECARLFKCVHTFIKSFGQNTACESWKRTLRCIWYPRKVDKVYHGHIFFMCSQAGRGRTNTGRNGGAGRRRFPACYIGSARRHTEHIQGLCLMLSKFLLSVFFSVALPLKSTLLCASFDRWCREDLLLWLRTLSKLPLRIESLGTSLVLRSSISWPRKSRCSTTARSHDSPKNWRIMCRVRCTIFLLGCACTGTFPREEERGLGTVALDFCRRWEWHFSRELRSCGMGKGM